MPKLSDMGHDQLLTEVQKLRKQKTRLQKKLKLALMSPEFIEVEGNRGGSLIRIQKDFDAKGNLIEGMIRLTVGETCVYTIRDQRISVAGLAAVLTRAKDIGFQKMIDDYLTVPCGSPAISIEHDLPPTVES